jgi:MFS superfamily sulfate permease-like transporter
MSSKNNSLFGNLKYDLPAGLVVFLVAMPLCLGIALASGAPLFSGIIAGIVGGIVVGAISGSPLGVSGPAAGLAAVVLGAIVELGSFETFLLAVLVAGVIQLLLGIVRAGVIGYYFPSSVIKGMLAGIGITIILKQIPHAFGYDKDPEGEESFFQPDGHNTFSEFWYMLEKIHWSAFAIAAISIVILILWDRKFFKENKFLKIIPGPLLVVIVGILINLGIRGKAELMLGAEHLVNVPVSNSVGSFLDQFSFPDFSQLNNPQVYFIGFIIAIVASLETLLCVEATDKMDPQKRITPTNRELIAQGSGNIVSSLVGGLPVTQVIVRSSANIQTGGRTKMSTIIHGFFLLISVIFLASTLNLIPLASLAGILIIVGIKLAKPSAILGMLKKGFGQFIPYILTMLGIVFGDMLIGIGLGLAAAIIHLLWQNFRTPYHFDPKTYVAGEPVLIELSEDVSFLNKASILRTLDSMPEGAHVIIDGSKARSIHPDLIEILEDFKFKAANRNIQFEVIGIDMDGTSGTDAKKNFVGQAKSAVNKLIPLKD